MKSLQYLFVLLGVVGLLISCEKSRVSQKELIAYLLNKENGLFNEHILNDIHVQVNYFPSALHHMNKKLGTDKVGRERQAGKIDDLSFFSIGLSANNDELLNVYTSKVSKHSKIINTLTYQTKDLIYIITSEDKKVWPTMAFYFPTYGLNNENKITAAFDNNEILSGDYFDLWLLDPGLGIGAQRFRFACHDIKNIPELIQNMKQ